MWHSRAHAWHSHAYALALCSTMSHARVLYVCTTTHTCALWALSFAYVRALCVHYNAYECSMGTIIRIRALHVGTQRMRTGSMLALNACALALCGHLGRIYGLSMTNHHLATLPSRLPRFSGFCPAFLQEVSPKKIIREFSLIARHGGFVGKTRQRMRKRPLGRFGDIFEGFLRVCR